MPRNLIEKINTYLNEQRVSIRRTVASYQEKLNGEKMTDNTKNLNILSNIVLPNYVKNCGIIADRVAQEWKVQTQQDLEKRIKAMFISDALTYAEQSAKDVFALTAQVKKEMEEIQVKEKQSLTRVGELHQQIGGQQRPALWRRIIFFWRWQARQVNLTSATRELMQYNGSLTFLRVKSRAFSIMVKTLDEHADYLSNHLLQRIRIIDGKINQTLVAIEAKIDQIEDEVLNFKGYQIDLHTRKKIEELKEKRLTDGTIESIARELLPELEKLNPEAMVTKLHDRFALLFEDLNNQGAMERLCEIYPRPDNVGTFFQSLAQKEGSPYCPLNNRLLDQTPLSITNFGVADSDKKEMLENAVDGRLKSGSYGVNLQTDANKIISLTSIHRIPIFALAGFSDYMTAIDLKLRYSRFAVYPERRWKDYAAVEPSTREVRVENLLVLGFASGLIHYNDQGWYQVNGYKIRGMAELKSRLATDNKTISRIESWWLDVYNNQGISGVIQKLVEGETLTSTVNGVSKKIQVISTRLVKLAAENPTQERFAHVLTSIE